MIIGRIITNDKRLKTLEFVEKTDKVSIHNDKIPTLIVGKSVAEELYGKDNIKVFNKQIDQYTYWTFSKSERRIDYEKDLENFNKLLIDRLRKSIKYRYFNILTSTLSGVKSFLSFIYNDEPKTCYITKSHIYIAYDKWVFGISVDILEYIGISLSKVINRISEVKSIRLINGERYFTADLNKYVKDDKIMTAYLL